MDVTCIHLDGNADTVEFCPDNPFHHILAAATYTLQESSQPCRVGTLSLFSIHDKTRLKFIQQIKTSGIFYMKWRPRKGNMQPHLLQADSDGDLTTYCLESLGMMFSHRWAREGGDALNIPLDISVLANMLILIFRR